MNAPGFMKHKRVLRYSLLTIVTALAGVTTNLWSDTTPDDQAEFKKRLYLGIGVGSSTLRPNPREPGILAVGDDSDIGYHLNLGYDVNRWLSTELYLAYLGEAGIDRIDTGNEQVNLDSIDYMIADISVLGYLFNSRSGLPGNDSTVGTFCREALSLYARLGLGVMRNDAENDVVRHGRNYRRHITVGAGVEYGFRNGVGIRGEWTGFDSDARYVNISLVKRFGQSQCQQPSRKKESKTTDSKPGIIGTVPKAPDKKPVPPIKAPTSYFGFDKSAPDTDSIDQLSVFARRIRDIPGTVHLTGHTDWSGSNVYNEQLSKRRVEAVRQLLMDNGVPAAKIHVNHRGEERPVSSNETKSGRALNRRVEVVFTEDQ